MYVKQLNREEASETDCSHLCVVYRYFVDVPKGRKFDKYIVNGKLQLLQGITGYAAPGVLTALMGGTGAGKTTLMDVLAGRKNTGVIEGELLVNGEV